MTHAGIRFLIAPNAFKGSIGADAAAHAIARGLELTLPDAECCLVPVADGGDGTLAVLQRTGRFTPRRYSTSDPLGRKMRAPVLFSRDRRTAVIELAQASGLDRLSPKERDPMRTTTKGVGELILKAASAGARHVILFVGGSATVDCGTGALSMLGVHFLDGRGGHVKPGGEGLERIRHIDANWVLDGLPRITVACDVVTPLIGPRGALMYAPQKGAGATELRHLDAGLRSFAQAVRSSCGRAIAKIPMGGAAGGFSAGFAGILGATLVHGAPYILSLLRFDKKLGHSDIVITGEGHLDEQSFHGKAPYEVAKLARVAGVPIIAMVGRTSRLKSRFFNAILPLTSETEDTLEAIRQTESRLMLCAASLGLALKASR